MDFDFTPCLRRARGKTSEAEIRWTDPVEPHGNPLLPPAVLTELLHNSDVRLTQNEPLVPRCACVRHLRLAASLQPNILMKPRPLPILLTALSLSASGGLQSAAIRQPIPSSSPTPHPSRQPPDGAGPAPGRLVRMEVFTLSLEEGRAVTRNFRNRPIFMPGWEKN